jgi:hypothetical protein
MTLIYHLLLTALPTATAPKFRDCDCLPLPLHFLPQGSYGRMNSIVYGTQRKI